MQGPQFKFLPKETSFLTAYQVVGFHVCFHTVLILVNLLLALSAPQPPSLTSLKPLTPSTPFLLYKTCQEASP